MEIPAGDALPVCVHCQLQQEILPFLLLTLQTSIECLANLAEIYRMFSGDPASPLARETDVIRAAYEARLSVLQKLSDQPS